MSEIDEHSNGFDKIKKLGFELFASGNIRRLTSNIFAVKIGSEGSYIIENKEGHWICDCPNYDHGKEFCEHIYPAQLAKNSNRNWETETARSNEKSIKCRYCGSPDISKCGFRYNARGISRRYFCNECERKFSTSLVDNTKSINSIPKETMWFLNELGCQISKLNWLLDRINSKLIKNTTEKSQDF